MPTEVRLNRGHMTNGIPSWAVPSNVLWDGERRLWHYFVPSWLGPVRRNEGNIDYPDHIPGYPCQIEDIIETQEYLKILEHAEIDVGELQRDLQRRMRVIRWLHHCNVEVARRWEDYYSKLPMKDVLAHPIWQDMGKLLKAKEVSYHARGGDRIGKSILFCDLDGVLADFTGGVKKMFNEGRGPRNSRNLWSRIKKTPKFFEDLKWTRDGRMLWECIRDLEPIIMTGVPPGAWAIEQKMNWLRREIGAVRVTFCKAKDKSIYKPEEIPHAILIDDRESLRPQWEKSGGTFIHHKNAFETLRQLQSIGIIEEIDFEYLEDHWDLKDTSRGEDRALEAVQL